MSSPAYQYSAVAADSDRQCIADLSHPIIGQSPEALGENTDGHALYGVEIHR